MIKNFLSLVKISHTIFALPFALVGFFIGVYDRGSDSFPVLTLLLILACMVFARNTAMAFNRLIDRNIDLVNPRTKMREIPSGLITTRSAKWFIGLNVLGFILCTFFINILCFLLSPVALAVIMGYSFTKRFTFLSHFVLGLGLSLAPIGAYLAVTGYFSWIPILYGVVVLLWVAGFDIIYAMQDVQFDTHQGLHSIPVRMGKTNALRLSTILHLICIFLMVLAGFLLASNYDELVYLHWIGAGIFIIMLIYQHLVVSPEDLSRVNLAFFTFNGFASVIFGTCLILDFFW